MSLRTSPGDYWCIYTTMLLNCDKSGAQFEPINRMEKLSAGADHLDVEIADLLAQGVAVHPQQVGRADLIAARCRQSRRQQRVLDLAQNAVIEPGRRQTLAEISEVARKVALHRCGDRVLAASLVIRRGSRLDQFIWRNWELPNFVGERGKVGKVNRRDLIGALPLGDRIRLALRWRRHYRKIVGPVLAIK